MRMAPGALLVYATCSIFEEENQQVVDAFLASPDMGEWQRVEKDFQSLPQLGGPDGHFACILRRGVQ